MLSHNENSNVVLQETIDHIHFDCSASQQEGNVLHSRMAAFFIKTTLKEQRNI